MKERFVINYFWVQSDHICAEPTLHHTEFVEGTLEELHDYIESREDGYENPYYKCNPETSYGFDYISNQGGVTIEDYVEPKFMQLS